MERLRSSPHLHSGRGLHVSEGTDAALLHSYSVFVCNDFCVCLLPLDIDLMVPRKTPLKSALWYVDVCFKSEKIKIKVFICNRGENFFFLYAFLYAESCTLPLSRAGVQKATTYGCSLTNRRGEDKRSRMWRWLHLLTPALCRLAYCSSTSLRAPSQSTPAR